MLRTLCKTLPRLRPVITLAIRFRTVLLVLTLLFLIRLGVRNASLMFGLKTCRLMLRRHVALVRRFLALVVIPACRMIVIKMVICRMKTLLLRNMFLILYLIIIVNLLLCRRMAPLLVVVRVRRKVLIRVQLLSVVAR